jgi:hypothetical protein
MRVWCRLASLDMRRLTDLTIWGPKLDDALIGLGALPHSRLTTLLFWAVSMEDPPPHLPALEVLQLGCARMSKKCLHELLLHAPALCTVELNDLILVVGNEPTLPTAMAVTEMAELPGLRRLVINC